MPIEVKWYDKSQAIIIAEFIGEWTWDEYHAADEQVAKLASDHTGRIDQILDFRQTSFAPSDDIMSHVGASINRAVTQLELSVNIQPPRMIISMLNILQATTQKPKRVIVQSLDEAIRYIDASRNFAD